MKSTAPDAHSTERLERIWRTSILPLLQEHHYGEWESVRRHYQLHSLLGPAGEVTGDVQAVLSDGPSLDVDDTAAEGE